MIENMKVISSRRAYEFPTDALRLTMLTTKPVQELIKDVFRFQSAQVAAPLPLFGDVPATIPPGLVFNYGLWATEGHSAVPIRLIHFEQTRIIIDVAGPSSAISPIYDRLISVMTEIGGVLGVTSDYPIIGQHTRMRDYSEIAVKCSWKLDSLIAPELRALVGHAAGFEPGNVLQSLSVSLFARPEATDLPSLGGIGVTDSRVLQFAPRLGTNPEDNNHFSGALLDSDAHIAYLRQLDEYVTR